MSLNRKALLERVVDKNPVVCNLPRGGSVLMRQPSGDDLLKWQASLRVNGEFSDERRNIGDHLLIATLLIDEETRELLFTIEDVLSGVFNSLPAADIRAMTKMASGLYGMDETEDDKRKNSSGTAPKE